jgi:cell division protein FtsB
MSDIQTSTIRVPKNVLEDIKIYCRKAGQPIGEWVEKAWVFLQKNDFDIYDTEATPFLPVPAEVEKERNQVDALCKLMSEFIISQKQVQLPTLDIIAKVAEEKAKAESRAEEQEKELQRIQEENNRLRNEIKNLQAYKEKAHRELCRVRDEQKTFGKIKVNTDL